MVQKKRNQQVDGLKGIAMLVVMAYHFFFRYAELYAPGHSLSIPLLGKWGVIGVTIFFVVSGCYVAQNPVGGGTNLVKKIARLWPIYIIAITLCFLITRLLPLPDRSVSIGDYFLNSFFINGFIGAPYVDSAHWYITDLIGCYIVFSIVNIAKEDRTRTILKTAFVVISLVLGFVVGKDESTIIWYVLYALIGSGRICLFLAGEAVFNFSKRQWNQAIYIEILSIVLCLLKFSILYAITMLAAQLLLWLALTGYLKLFSLKPLSSIGEASYSIYAFHQNIGFIVIFYLTDKIGRYSFGISAIVYILMLLWGLFAYRYIEKPIRGALRKANI